MLSTWKSKSPPYSAWRTPIFKTLPRITSFVKPFWPSPVSLVALVFVPLAFGHPLATYLVLLWPLTLLCHLKGGLLFTFVPQSLAQHLAHSKCLIMQSWASGSPHQSHWSHILRIRNRNSRKKTANCPSLQRFKNQEKHPSGGQVRLSAAMAQKERLAVAVIPFRNGLKCYGRDPDTCLIHTDLTFFTCHHW